MPPNDDASVSRLEVLIQSMMKAQSDYALQTVEQLRALREDVKEVTALHNTQALKLADHDRRFQERADALRMWEQWRERTDEEQSEMRADILVIQTTAKDLAQRVQAHFDSEKDSKRERVEIDKTVDRRLTILERAWWGLLGAGTLVGILPRLIDLFKH